MKLVTVYFDYPGSNNYKRLLNAMINSAENIGYKIKVIPIDPPEQIKNKRSHDSNTVKLGEWSGYLDSLKEGEHVVFLDCDLIFLKPIEDAFNHDFDVAYTYRDNGVPLNGGVVFLRNNKYARAFIKQWTHVNEAMYSGTMPMKPYVDKYCGINQSALGYLLEEGDLDCDIEALPCSIYNACGDKWRSLDPDTRIIHIKDELRRACLRTRFAPWLNDVINIWDQFDTEPEIV